jgi:exoribonuclease-2
MHLLYEEGGDIKIATLITAAGAETDPLAVESLGGKRGKLKSKDVWLRFQNPPTTAISDFLPQAKIISDDIDLNFVWECAGPGEFQFLDLAKEYFGESSTPLQQAALAIALQGAPIYFRRKGRGQFLRAPEDQLKAALLAVEKKKVELAKQEFWEAELRAGKLPEEINPLVNALLFAPDKNTTAYKAVFAASQGLKGGIPELFLKCGVLGSALAYHEGKFLKEHFPKGVAFNVALGPNEEADWQVALNQLPEAAVRAFSIDDASTTEIDDAFSVTPVTGIPNCYRIGIHIAAPALAIQRGGALDQIARQRLSTVYFPGGKITMLPEQVIEVFSLHAADNGIKDNEGVVKSLGDLPLRPAVSLYITVDADGLPILEGEHAPMTKVERVPMAHNLRLDDLEDLVTEESLADVSNSANLPYQNELAVLWRSAKQLHARRQEQRVTNGLRAEVLGPPDPQALARDFNFSVVDDVVEIKPRQRGSVLDSIVAEWMIYCNSTWGNQLASHSVPGIYRAQKGWGPQRTRMQTLPGPHEGLGVENYSWCTSPLRRYVDLVNQWQLIAMAQHGVTAKLVAPFKPKDADLMAIAADFDGTYAAYGEHQNQMERYWCLMHLKQLGLPWKGVVRHLKEGQARVEEIPLRLNVPELSEQARGARAEVEVSDIDFLSLETSVRYLGLIDSGNDMEIVFQGDAEVQSEVSPRQEPTIDQQNSQPDVHPGVSQ